MTDWLEVMVWRPRPHVVMPGVKRAMILIKLAEQDVCKSRGRFSSCQWSISFYLGCKMGNRWEVLSNDSLVAAAGPDSNGQPETSIC